MRDLVVAGGGPVGMAAALHAHRAGLDVVVREPRPGPIDKACGEGLMPGAVAELAALGVEPRGHDIAGIRYLDGHGGRAGVAARFGAGPGRGVRRTVLHAALAEQLAVAGIDVEPRPVRSVRDGGDHLEVDGEPTRYLVAADGLHSPTRRLVGLEAGRPSGRRRFGLRCHVQQAPWSDFVEVHWSPRAEAYVTPVDDDLVGVAILTGAADGLRRGAGRLPRAARTARRASGRGCGVPAPCASGCARGRPAACCSSATPPATSTRSPARASPSVSPRRGPRWPASPPTVPSDYERQARRIGLRQEVLTHALLLATGSPVLRRRLVPAAERLPWVFSTAVNQLARPIEVPA